MLRRGRTATMRAGATAMRRGEASPSAAAPEPAARLAATRRVAAAGEDLGRRYAASPAIATRSTCTR